MLWIDCMSSDFYKFVCSQENFSYLNGKNVLYPKIADIVWKFIHEDETNCTNLHENLRKNKIVLQYVFSPVYLDVYCNSKRRGFDLKSEFQIKLKEHKDKRKSEQYVKDPSGYKNRAETFFFE